MVGFRSVMLAVVLALGVGGMNPVIGELTFVDIRCEYSVNPLGLDHPAPRFSWVLGSDQRGVVQSAYQVLVATSEQTLAAGTGDKWDSGKISSDRSVNVPYAGSELHSGERCFWKVRCWNAADQVSAWSAPATFEMGLMNQADFQAPWIRMDGDAVYRAGKSGLAVNLDGIGQAVRVAHRSGLKPASQITLSAWVQPGPELSEPWREIYRKDDSTARHLLALGKTGSVHGIWVGLGIGGSYVEFGAPVDQAVLKDGQWHHVATTFDGSELRIYFDGALVGSQARSGTLNTSGEQPAYIGASRGSAEFFPGGIDEMRIYGRALSSEEVQAIADSNSPSDSGLLAWWRFDGDLTDQVSGEVAEAQGIGLGSPLMRKTFQIEKVIDRARVYMAGVGWSELYVNGTKAGDNVLDPAATDYDKRVLYVTHDVTAMLHQGTNVLGVMLGNGWFSEPPSPGYGPCPQLRFQLHVSFTDGTSSVIQSDESWKVTSGPILRNDIFNGEIYDARLDRSGWLLPGYDASTWDSATVTASPGGVMESQVMPPIKVTQTLAPLALTNPAPGVYVYDLGQVFGGWARLRMQGPAGTKVTIKYATELLAATGLVDKRYFPEPRATDYYTLKGDPAGEIYEPRFTYHPVRYVQLEGYPGTPTLNSLEGRVVHSAVDLSGDFACSNELFNQIHRNAVWTLRNQMYGFPLDCLGREHWGWLEPGTNPSTVMARKFFPLFWDKFLKDARYAQHADGVIPDVVPAYPLKGRKTGDPAWAGNYPLLVWHVYQYYDDRRILEEHYASMKKWVDHLTSIATGHRITTGYYGDHMLPGDAPGQEQFISQETPPPLLWTGFYYRNARILADTAAVLGLDADAQQYAALAESIKAALNAEWLDPDQHLYATGSQTSNLFALVLGIVPEADQAGVVARVEADILSRGKHFRTGNAGTASLMEASLASHGKGELMYEVMNQTSYPGYGYMVAQGATALWESWTGPGGYDIGQRDGLEPSMDMWGSVDEFFYRDVAGIRGSAYFNSDSMTPGFKLVEIRPHVLGDLEHAGASFRTVRGMVSSQWRIADDRFTLQVEIPVNAEGRVSVPVFGSVKAVIRERDRVVWNADGYVAGGDGIVAAASDGQYITFDVGSGSYAFSIGVPVINVDKKKRYSEIQPAIDEAETGDEIVLSPGEYVGSLVIGATGLKLRARSTGDPTGDPVVIRGDGTSPTISLTAAGTEAFQLIGLVITGADHQADGGGILCSAASPTIINCTIQGNSAQRGGGIASLLGASPRLINCILRGNSAELGGAVYCSGGDISLVNCTLAANTALEGASLACRSPRLASPSEVIIRNSILWNQAAEVANFDVSSIDIAHSTVYGGWPGQGNLSSDPLFVRQADLVGGDWGDLHLRPCSNSADAAAVAFLPTDLADLDADGDLSESLPIDLDGRPRIQGAAPDMGAYEGVRTGQLLADMNGDCAVDIGDLVIFSACGTGAGTGPPASGCESADLDGDNDVDQEDFGMFQICLSAPGGTPGPACLR